MPAKRRPQAENRLGPGVKKMSVIMNLYYTGTNGSAREFAREMIESGTVDRIRAEEGNLRYEYFVSLEDPETVLLVDMWRDQAALDAHHASSMMETITRLRERHDLHMRAERLMPDDENQHHDDAFLRS